MRRTLPYIMVLIMVLLFGHAQAENNLQEIKQDFSDSMITTKITAKFAKNKELNPLKIYVSTEDGVVSLSGYVKDRDGFISAIKTARDTKGVTKVTAEKLNIKQVNMGLTDAYITAKVEAAIFKAKVLDDERIPLVGINASTDNGKVTLTGKVKRTKSILAIIKRVKKIKGVKEIVCQLTVDDKKPATDMDANNKG